MKGVRFTKDMMPWGKGQTAMLPEKVAAHLIYAGEAEAFDFPSNAFGTSDPGKKASVEYTKDMGPASRDPRQQYRTKGR